MQLTRDREIASASPPLYLIPLQLNLGVRHDDALYIAGRAVGSDARTNGGAIFLWFTPIVLGVASLRTKRIAVWKSVWLIATGVIGSRLFAQFVPGTAFVAEGALWIVVGYIAYAGGSGA